MNGCCHGPVLIFSALLPGLLGGCGAGQPESVTLVGQYPSPMADSIRAHGRIPDAGPNGLSVRLDDVLTKPIEVYVPDRPFDAGPVDVLVHFHGAAHVPRYAVDHSGHPMLLAVVNLGSGSSVYETAFREKSTFLRLVESAVDAIAQHRSMKTQTGKVYLSSFSAGYGAVRAILRDHADTIEGILLLDGLHTDYVPPRRVLAEGGRLNDQKLQGFVQFARLAKAGRKRLLITHSEIFPGTYASTTETADFVLGSLGLQRGAVLRWGPVGMQRLTETRAGRLTVLGYAGNSAPDHADHFHGLPVFLDMLLAEPLRPDP